ncbi:NAD(P)H-dependent oxidoreductase [Streptomyces sp. RerS4]|uniref:NADPH-dependent FMN reductase n=1 Tax=Streptomyces sp. RerS4 TaxID=2942449 RepID=UPI00201BEC65|nr:NAD(P)H-dependent oxidoreductase [Streptomyces sp. RerS4]UQX05464.1 NAD(P)H-dependent oxidoreductase [Streptomyces sp. RerS4]
MSVQSPRLAFIVGSNRPGRFGHTVASWFLDRATTYGYRDIDVIDLAEADLPTVLGGPDAPRPPAVEALARRIDAADAFVVVTPEYNHSFPAPLKNAIDWFRHEWYAKPVGFVSYGGISGGLRAVEQLRLVFSELHATTVRDGVSFHRAWEQFDEEGAPRDRAGCDGAAKIMLDQLDWWAKALGEARAKRPYAS